jgi:hypothetical protein
MQQVPVVLAAQDTTEFNLAHLPATEGLGHGTGNNLRGFMMHSLLAVTPDGLPLGVLGMMTWVRPPEEYGKKQQRKQRPIQDKILCTRGFVDELIRKISVSSPAHRRGADITILAMIRMSILLSRGGLIKLI